MERQHKFHRSLRLLDYDYSQAGAYFVTICTEQRLCHLGRIVAGSVQLTVPGQIVQEVWESLPQRFAGIELDAMVVMPNHVHGIVILPDGTSHPLGSIVRTFKAASTRLIREAGFPQFSWQGNYYEHVIRGYPELDRVRRYIANNPVQWELDEENPERQAR